MIKLKLNEEEFEITSFNKMTFFTDEGIRKTGSCDIQVDNVATIEEMSEDEITTFEIYNNDDLIYEIEDAHIKFDYLSEVLMDGAIVVTLNLKF